MKLGKIVMTGKPMPEAEQFIRQHCEVKSWDEPGVNLTNPRYGKLCPFLDDRNRSSRYFSKLRHNFAG